MIKNQINCIAEDMSYKPYYSYKTGSCVAGCPSGTVAVGYTCVPEDDPFNQREAEKGFESLINGIARDLHTCTKEIVSLCFIALTFAFCMLLVLRYMAAVFVWIAIGGVIAACGIATGVFWYLTDSSEGFLPLAIFFSIFTVVIILVVLVMRKRILLVIQLLKEAGKSITAMPLIIFEPLLTFLALAILWTAWIYFMLYIESAGIPTVEGGRIIYKQNFVMRFTYWYNIFIMLWMVQFVYGCQNMFIAGAVSVWYFTRDKSNLARPVFKNVKNVMKYHLGTISLGSFIIALIQIIRILFRSFRRYFRLLGCCFSICCVHNYIQSGLSYFETWMKYFTRNAYIITSIHGYSFCEAGSRAFKLLVENALRVIAINSVGDFVLVLAKLLVVTCTVLIATAMLQDKEHVQNAWAPILLVGIMAYLIAHCFLTVYEMAIDTIFICFCEDCEINDGMARPYFMSQGLMLFVENSKSVLGIKEEQ
ncbi:hypothetical protein ILUMI_20637 [Ignelater luminosus]|uniref:Choline transporter-like protein n=1 Tax=Ignelater luminosus TaxID=2038154 RepID=A0A8K0G4F2_IGNLU|nr:hypothetical protein ILUMI_20637 [Ignelater luminosus]